MKNYFKDWSQSAIHRAITGRREINQAMVLVNIITCHTLLHQFYLNLLINTKTQYYTIIDFNEVDIRIYLPEK